jgi:Xaa-Pro aminopeptidase
MAATKLPGDAVAFERVPLPKRFCNLERLLFALEARGLDGIVATLPYNVFYLTGFNAIAHKADEPRPYAVILSRHAPERPILVVADYYLATFLKQPTWVEDVRPFRAVMMPLDLPARGRRISTASSRATARRWPGRARTRELCLRHGHRRAWRPAGPEARLWRVAFDDMGRASASAWRACRSATATTR